MIRFLHDVATQFFSAQLSQSYDNWRASASLTTAVVRHPMDCSSPFQRVLSLIEAHALQPAQALDLVLSEWGWTYATLTNEEEFNRHWNADQARWVAGTFNVELDWLNGASEYVFNPLLGYKDLPTLLQILKRDRWISDDLRLTVLAEEYEGENAPLNKYALLFSQPIRKLDDGTTVFRHALFDTAWNWYHPPCYWDTKAIARWFTMRNGRKSVIPIISVEREDFRALVDRRVHPAKFFTEWTGNCDHFEYRVLLASESARAIETDEMPMVFNHLDSHGLFQPGMPVQSVGPN